MYRKRTLSLVIVTLLVLFGMLSVPASAAPPPPTAGFTADKAAWELQYEAALKAIPDPAVAAKLSNDLTEHPTLVASAWDKWNVDYSVNYLKGLGLNPEVYTYYPYISIPNQIQVELVAPTAYSAKTKENPWPWQKYFDDVVVGYNAYTPAGDVTADLVYVNYGLPPDYETLEQMGVSVQGKIAIARYGGSFRGVKNKVAYEHGAAGLILFSDPEDDGFLVGPVYPDGPWRSPDGIQRGSLEYIFNYPGDPLTPGWAATEKAHRLSPAEAYNLPPAVPTTPLGYGEAAPLLQALDGQQAPPDWQGGLSDPRWGTEMGGTPFTYHVGGTGNTKVHLKVDVDYAIKPVWDIVVKIPGSKHPDEVVVVGAHRDGWTYGTGDSNSGYIVVMEMARALKQLMDQGWQPDRTIVLAGWDGEEYGLLGSVEWGEQFQQLLGKQAVAYINLDGAGGGQYFYAAGVPSLDQLVYDVTKEVEEPRTPGHSIYEDWVNQWGGQTPQIDREGGGSDFSVFLDYIGIPVIDLGFYSPGGNYHSSQDDLYWMQRWGDPGYLHHAACARLAGIAALRLANADALPLVYSTYAGEVQGYLSRLETLYPQDEVDFAREKAAAAQWQQAATALEGQVNGILAANASLSPALEAKVNFINGALMRQERDLTQPKGLPDRPWFKHVIYAPGLYTGYAVQYLSALEDEIAAQEWSKVRNYAALLNNSLRTATNTARTAAKAR